MKRSKPNQRQPAEQAPAAPTLDSTEDPIVRELRRRGDVADQARRKRDPADQDYLREIDYWRGRREELLTCPTFVTVIGMMPEAVREEKAAKFFQVLCHIHGMIECGLMNVDTRSWKLQFLPWDERKKLAIQALEEAGHVLGDAKYTPVIMGIARQIELEKEPPKNQHPAECFNSEHLAKAGGGSSDSQWFGLFVKQLAEYVPDDIKTRGATRATIVAELLRIVGMKDAKSKNVRAILNHAETYQRKRF